MGCVLIEYSNRIPHTCINAWASVFQTVSSLETIESWETKSPLYHVMLEGNNNLFVVFALVDWSVK